MRWPAKYGRLRPLGGCGPLAAVPPGPGARLITDLPDRLRQGTRDLHTQAERAGLMPELLAGRIAAPVYARLLRNLHALYAALEEALQASAEGALLPLAALRREAALAHDLAALQGPRWHEEIPLHAATAAYVARLRDVAQARPRLLLAHAYLRYLGDLHGGQLLQRQVVRALGGPQAVSFYDFGPPERVLALREQVRDVLGLLPVDEAEAALFVDEARWGFQQHQKMFEGLAQA